MIVLLVLGCSPDQTHQGVLVGNPGEGTVQTARVTGGTFQSGAVHVSSLIVEDCNENSYTLLENVTIGLLGNSRFTMPASTLCMMEMRFDGPLGWLVEDSDGDQFEVSIELETIAVYSWQGFSTSDQNLVLQLGQQDWLDEGLIDLSKDIINDNALTELIFETSALYADTDNDGIADDEGAPLALTELEDTGEEWEDDPEEDVGCGDGEGEFAVAFLAIPLVVLGRRRRRRPVS